jgi:hypothetical protein
MLMGFVQLLPAVTLQCARSLIAEPTDVMLLIRHRGSTTGQYSKDDLSETATRRHPPFLQVVRSAQRMHVAHPAESFFAAKHVQQHLRPHCTRLTAVTRIPCFPYSTAAVLVNASTSQLRLIISFSGFGTTLGESHLPRRGCLHCWDAGGLRYRNSGAIG